MYVEKKRLAVDPRPFILDGNGNGRVAVSDIRGFFVGQIVQIRSDTLQPTEYKIKRFISKTEFRVGPPNSGVSVTSSTSQFLVTDNAKISAEEQARVGITEDEIQKAEYAEEPIVAKRVIGVDEYGDYYSLQNPLPVFPVAEDISEVLAFSVLNRNAVQDVLLPITLPNRIRYYSIKIRNSESYFEVYDSLAGTNFVKVSRGSIFSTERIVVSDGYQVFIKAPKNCVVEVSCWAASV